MSEPPRVTPRPARVDQRDPLNIESDLSLLDSVITPPDRFFVRTHFDVPRIDPDEYRLIIDGHVAHRRSLTLPDISALADDEVTATLECAGNGRANLETPVAGLQWAGGAVGTGQWRGVRLGRLLEMAGVRDGADSVLLGGVDEGTVAAVPDGPIRFERSLPLAKAFRPEVLVATTISGGPLPSALGGPVRAIVGGWYGMASVKWLTRITVLDAPGSGHWETTDYSYAAADAAGAPVRRPITEILPKAQIATPVAGATVQAGADVRVRGFAWAGEARVARVDVSDDDGASWLAARLLDEPEPGRWTRWQSDWRADRAGERSLLVRCTDDRGRTQPMVRDPGRGGYLVNEVVPHPVTVEDRPTAS
jgi:DMSO/TMAO reductase YedYZ molybdopterin-dependent catalytic subunit